MHNQTTYADNVLEHKDGPVIRDMAHFTDKNSGFEEKQVSLLALPVPVRYSKPILKHKYASQSSERETSSLTWGRKQVKQFPTQTN
jgi:hypothetical protein